MSKPTDRLTLTVAEAAQLLSVSVDAVYDAVNRGDLHAVRVGRRICIARRPLMVALGLENEEQSCRA